MILTIVFVDLCGYTAETEARGDVVGNEAKVRLAQIERSFLSYDANAKRLGLYQGDGMLLVSHEPMRMLESALRQQAVILDGLPCRIALGIGDVGMADPEDEGKPPSQWAITSTVNGRIVNFSARLLDVCPPGGVTLNEGIYALAARYPRLRGMLHRQSGILRGFDGEQVWFKAGLGEVAECFSCEMVTMTPGEESRRPPIDRVLERVEEIKETCHELTTDQKLLTQRMTNLEHAMNGLVTSLPRDYVRHGDIAWIKILTITTPVVTLLLAVIVFLALRHP